MLKHLRIIAVGLLAVIIFTGCGENSKSSSGSSSGTESKKLDPAQLLAEGKKAIEEDKKLGIVFEDIKNGIILKKFPQDSNIKSYKIPYGVTVIGYAAFDGCKKLTSITLPDTIESMHYNAFDNIKEVIAAQKNTNFYFDNRGVLFNKITKSLLAAPSNLTGNYVIPNNITKIGNYAFRHTKLTSITIPNSVTKIGEYAFLACSNLNSITLPAKFKGQEKRLAIPETCKVTYR